jgi:ABC-type Na+ efflux pump permease subunit
MRIGADRNYAFSVGEATGNAPVPVKRHSMTWVILFVSFTGGLAGIANSLIVAYVLGSIAYLAFGVLLECAVGFVFGLVAGLLGAGFGKVRKLATVRGNALIKSVSVVSGTVAFGVLWWFSALTFIPAVQPACMAVGLCSALLLATVFWVAWPRSGRDEAS